MMTTGEVMKKNLRSTGAAVPHGLAISRPVLTVAAAMVATLFGTAAMAEPMLQHRNFSRLADMSRWTDNYVELGVVYNSKDSYKFGEWNGLREDGPFAVVGFNWLSRAQENDAAYWRVNAAGLGLETRQLAGEFGVQGRWKLTGSADRLVRSELDSGRYIHQGLGGSRLTLAPGCSGFASITAINTACLQPYKVEQGRDFYRLGYNVALSDVWDFAVNYREDVRDGTRGMGYITNSGQSLAVLYPHDDSTQQVETLLSYASDKAQLQVGYSYSRYQNDVDALQLTNPIGATPTENRMSLAPDNQYHQLQATGSYLLAEQTRLTGKVSYGIGTQDQSFLPYSINGAAATAALPRSSLDGDVVKTLVDLSLTTRPTRLSNLKLGYQYYDYDNRTPIATFRYAGRDAAAQGADASAFTRTNAPLSWAEHKATVDGDYSLSGNTLLRGLVEYRQVDYELTDRTRTETTKAGVELRRPILDSVQGNVGYTYTERTGSEYNKNVFFRNSYSNVTFQDSANGGLTNHPSIRAFMYADYDEDRVRASANWAVSETVSLQSSVDGFRQTFKGPNCGTVIDPKAIAALGTNTLPDTCLGRTLADGGTVNLDLQWQPEENLSAFTFLTLTESVMEQAGRTWSRATATTQAGDQARNWFGRSTNQDHAVGFGARWQPKETIDLGGQYVFSHSVSKVAINTASGLSPSATPLPDAESTVHTVQLYAKWNVSRKMTLRLNYLYETLDSSNWAYDGIGATANGSVLMTGQASPKYENHVIGVSVALNSW